MAKKGFSLLEVTVSILIMGLTITALLNILEWSNTKYRVIATSWKERSCFTSARTWLREQITAYQESNVNIKQLTENVKCPEGFNYHELTISKHDNNTFFVKIGLFEDRNRNGKADENEKSNRLFCFRRRSV